MPELPPRIRLEKREEKNGGLCPPSAPPTRGHGPLDPVKGGEQVGAQFELWYLLHFHYYDTAIDIDSYKKMLSGLLDRKYQKNSRDMYATLKDKQDAAIRNARKLLERYNPHVPEKDNPSTTVHLLVEELNVYRSDKWGYG
ncbi:MAG: RloB family protein [Candidatus Magnetobacterium sp. LHC-1]